jgi:hypothetical protein
MGTRNESPETERTFNPPFLAREAARGQRMADIFDAARKGPGIEVFVSTTAAAVFASNRC